jgi:hypothetical protein
MGWAWLANISRPAFSRWFGQQTCSIKTRPTSPLVEDVSLGLGHLAADIGLLTPLTGRDALKAVVLALQAIAFAVRESSLTFVCDPLACVGDLFSFVGDSIPFVGDPIALVGKMLSLLQIVVATPRIGRAPVKGGSRTATVAARQVGTRFGDHCFPRLVLNRQPQKS